MVRHEGPRDSSQPQRDHDDGAHQLRDERNAIIGGSDETADDHADAEEASPHPTVG